MNVSVAEGSGEIKRFDPALHGREALLAGGLVLVAMFRPHKNIFPGIQTLARVHNGVPDVRYAGAVIGDTNPILAATRLQQQVAYSTGLPPGHAGMHYSDRSFEPLVSSEAKHRLAEVAERAPYVGYLGLIGANKFEGRTDRSFGSNPTTRGTWELEDLVGLTLTDVNELMGPGGIAGLRDATKHPVARNDLLAAGLRPGEV